MPPDVDLSLIRRGALVLLVLAALALSACQTSRMLVHKVATAAHVSAPAAPQPSPPADNFPWLARWLAASPKAQASQLAGAEAAYRKHAGPRATLHLAILLGLSGRPGTNLPRAQSLLQTLLADPTPQLSPTERTVARLDLTLITQRLTEAQKNSTLQASNASEITQLNAQLDATTDQNVALQRQLDEALAKLAAIANIEKSMNQGKLGALGTPK
jgi:uncharacterized protein HemX